MQKGIINIATKLGFDISLYQSSSETKKSIVLGHYIYQAEKLLQEELISDGKYEELLLDAFRDDIVYGAYTDGGEVID